MASTIDFKKINLLEQELQELLNQRPEYRIWFENIRKEIDRQAGKNKHNRCVVAIDIMLTEFKKMTPALEDLKKEIINFSNILEKYKKGK